MLRTLAPDILAALRDSLDDPRRVSTRAIDLSARANDASHFLLTPRAVATASSADEVAALLGAAARHALPLTFRSGGTSLSGQAISDGLLVDVRRDFKDIEVLDGGERVRVAPGVIVRALNARLAPYGRKFGPDPASESAATIGGVIANNSSGMACGVIDNAYRTLESLTVVLPSGTVIDTGAADAEQRFRTLEPILYEGIMRLARRVRENPVTVAIVRRQFSMKNTMGYGVNAFLDHERGVDILAHLMVGSEGTLGFVADAVFRTVPVHPQVSNGLLVFPDLESANAALPSLLDTGAATLELLDALSLRIGQRRPGMEQVVGDLEIDQHAALLVEYQADDQDELGAFEERGAAVVRELGIDGCFGRDLPTRSRLWQLRKGIIPSVAGARPPGTTSLLEDIAVPVPALVDTCVQLKGLFHRYRYPDSAIFGHAKDGNIHFMLTDAFAEAGALERFAGFTEDLVDLVLGQGGALKAEHGTGRVMAPYVRRQFGDELYEVMREIKALFDPVGILNPGVIINDDDEAHLKDIKTMPVVDQIVDRCTECGWCEPVCPSRNLTLTPRQRIVTLRAIEQARIDGDERLVAELERDYDYASVQTCAVDGMCQTACPVGINTGSLVKKMRSDGATAVESRLWDVAAKNWKVVTAGASLALTVVGKAPAPLVRTPNAVARAALGDDRVPLYSAELPGGGRTRRRPAPGAPASAVYFPACVGSMFGPADAGGTGVQFSFEELCRRAGISLLVPPGIDGLCCGMPMSSKGMNRGKESMWRISLAALHQATRGGRLPIICDASTCTEELRVMIANDSSPDLLTVIDVVEFAEREVLPRLPEFRRIESMALHPTCSSTRMGGNPALERLAHATAERVDIAEDWGCCGFAGDRGMLHPELTESATGPEAADVALSDVIAHASCNRTCELGMTRATGKPYRHILEWLEEATRNSGA